MDKQLAEYLGEQWMNKMWKNRCEIIIAPRLKIDNIFYVFINNKCRSSIQKLFL